LLRTQSRNVREFTGGLAVWTNGRSVEDRWGRLEEIVRRVVREELAAMKLGKQKLGFANGKWIGITEEQMTVWADAYPSCDLVVELKKAAAWIVSNPHLAPKSQFGRFLNTWFARQQNQLSIRSIPTRNDRPLELQPLTCAYCPAPKIGVVNGIPHCRPHTNDAMDQKPRPARAA
jgi:hypothetical protein